MKSVTVGLNLVLLFALLAASAHADEKEGKVKTSPVTRVQTIVIGPDGKAPACG